MCLLATLPACILLDKWYGHYGFITEKALAYFVDDPGSVAESWNVNPR